MVSSVQLGNFYSSGGKTLLGGAGGSGIDTKSIIEGLVAAKQVPITALEDKIAVNAKKSSAISQFKTLAARLKDATDLMRNVPGFNKASGNAFDYVKATVSSNTSIAGSTYMNVTVEPGTRAQNYTVGRIIQTATATKQSAGEFAVANADTAVVVAAGPAANQFQAGTVVVNGHSITLAADDTLNQVAAKFNAVSDDTGIVASVVKIADNSFKLFFTGTVTGEDAAFQLDPDEPDTTVVDGDGVFAMIDFDLNQPAQNAEFILDGETIIRATNTIDDALDGVTFSLLQATPFPDDTDLTVSISPDTGIAKSAIVGFLNAYNDIKIFAAQQVALDADGTYAESAVLATDATLRSAVNAISTELSRIVSGLDADKLRQLSDLGVEFVDLPATLDAEGNETQPAVRNALNLNESKLDSALASKFDQVRKVFEFTFASSNSNLTSFTRTNALGVSEFTLTITPGTSYSVDYTDSSGSHTIQMDGELFSSGGGYRLTGRAGTVLEGLVLLYGSTDAGTATVNVSQGIGDRLYNLAASLLEDQTGAIALNASSVTANTEKLQKDIDAMNTQLEVYRQQLLDKYARLEQAISRVNSILQSISANDDARNNA